MKNVESIKKDLEDIIVSIQRYKVGDFETKIDLSKLIEEARKVVEYLEECNKNPKLTIGMKVVPEGE